MAYPKLIFKENKTLDLEVALSFKNIKAGGVNFRETGILAPHPSLKKYKTLSQTVLKNYISSYYLEHKEELSCTCKKTEGEWKNIAPKFFSLTKELFHNSPWPKGKYICYLSIWNCNPRNLQAKTFQIFYKNKFCRETIIHEMLHFMFYDYLFKNYKICKEKKYLETIWNISEVFNVVIQNSPLWRKILKTEEEEAYPAHKELVRKMKQKWKTKQDIDYLIKEVLPK
ncbi:MAG: hypothetical protein ABH919_03915 [bacterium]